MLSPRLSKPFLTAFLAVGATVLVVGCAPSVHKKGLEDMRLTGELVDKVQKEGEVTLAGTDGVVCRLEMPTGTHISIWRCDTVEGASARADANQREIQRAQGGPKPKVTN